MYIYKYCTKIEYIKYIAYNRINDYDAQNRTRAERLFTGVVPNLLGLLLYYYGTIL